MVKTGPRARPIYAEMMITGETNLRRTLAATQSKPNEEAIAKKSRLDGGRIFWSNQVL